jgi:hypothetical protein
MIPEWAGTADCPLFSGHAFVGRPEFQIQKTVHAELVEALS